MDAILFDLDGTLLPMDTPRFFGLYTEAVGRFLNRRYGYSPQLAVPALWGGTAAMARNNGADTNANVFWRHFAGAMGEGALDARAEMERFYEADGGFAAVRAACRENPAAAPLVRGLKKAGHRVVLATNPVYPLAAVRTRLGWIGLAPEDFDLVTHYDNSVHAKPNPAYYTDILARLGAQPGRCLHIGNDVDEDGAALAAGLPVYLVTDCLLNPQNRDVSGFEQGNFAQMCRRLGGL